MRLGLLSDTHGDVAAAAAAVRALKSGGASMLIHLGDVGNEAVLAELLAFDRGEVHVVFGNCDDASTLARHAVRLGLRSHDAAGIVEFDGRTIGFTHGHLLDLAHPRLVDQFLDRLPAAPHDRRLDYLAHGHTHLCCDEQRGAARIINPGALHRAATLTVALLEPATATLEFITVTPIRTHRTELDLRGTPRGNRMPSQ